MKNWSPQTQQRVVAVLSALVIVGIIVVPIILGAASIRKKTQERVESEKNLSPVQLGEFKYAEYTNEEGRRFAVFYRTHRRGGICAIELKEEK